jgi:hypothetical protein
MIIPRPTAVVEAAMSTAQIGLLTLHPYCIVFSLVS